MAKAGDSFHVVDYKRMLAKQKGVCALCGKNPKHARAKRLNADHDHKTGGRSWPGLLAVAIGFF